MSGYRKCFRPAAFVLGAGLTYEWTRNQVGEVVPVRGASMQPTLNPSYEEVDVANERHAPLALHQDRVFVRRINESHLTLGLGDVVTCVDPHDRRQVLIKRVVGLRVTSWRRGATLHAFVTFPRATAGSKATIRRIAWTATTSDPCPWDC